jgi:4-hydroxybenzoate polyprenyltransferase
MVFAAALQKINMTVIILYIIAAWWPVIYDTEYAMVDREDDKKIGIKSTAILFGDADRWVLGLLQLVWVGLLVGFGIRESLHVIYFMGVVIAGLSFLLQQYYLHKRENDYYFKAFLNNQWVGFFIFLGIALSFCQ